MMPAALGTTMKIKIAVLIIFCSAGLALGQEPPAAVNSKDGAESELAALAKKEALRREALPEKGAVITNIELLRLLGDMRSSQAPVAASIVSLDNPEGTDGADEGGLPDSAKDEKEALLDEMRDALRNARQSVETASNSFMVLELRINYLRNHLYQEADPQRQQMLQQELNQAAIEIGEVRESEAEARRQLDQVRKEAQMAGLLPGEIRDIVGTVPVTRSTSTID